LIEKGVQLSEYGQWTWPQYLTVVLGHVIAHSDADPEQEDDSIKIESWDDVSLHITAAKMRLRKAD
jgi:hypothetical protein